MMTSHRFFKCKYHILVFMASFISFSASSGLADTEGLAGSFSILLGTSGSSSRLSTEQPAKLTDDGGRATQKYQIIPIGNLHFTYGDKLQHQTYIGAVRDDVSVGMLSFQIGQRFQSRDGILIDISYLPTLLSRDVWKDPYFSSAPREKTTETGNAYRLKLGNLLSGKLGFEFALAQNEIEEEKVLDPSLIRSADTFLSKIDYIFPLNSQYIIKPSITYLRHKAEGAAASYKAASTDLTFIGKSKKHQFSMKVSAQFDEYDEASYEFSDIRKDTRLGVVFANEYHPSVFGENWSVVSLLKYEKIFSNIEFYDSQEWLISTGFSYRF